MSQSTLDASWNASILTVNDRDTSNADDRHREPEKPASGLDKEIQKSLSSSFVYLRAEERLLLSPDASSSTMSARGWSFLSRFSLAEVSDLSVISLPIAVQELWDSDQYKTNLNYETIYEGICTEDISHKWLEDASQRYDNYLLENTLLGRTLLPYIFLMPVMTRLSESLFNGDTQAKKDRRLCRLQVHSLRIYRPLGESFNFQGKNPFEDPPSKVLIFGQAPLAAHIPSLK